MAFNYSIYKCTICPAIFGDMQECLRHELLYKHHNEQLKPSKNLRIKVKAVLNRFEMDDHKIVRNNLKKILEKWKPSHGVSSINKCYSLSDEKLKFISNRVKNCLKALLPEKTLKIQPFGSFVCGLALIDSDLDFFIKDERCDLINKTTTNPMYNKIYYILRKSANFGDVLAIRHARVPIINCWYYPAGVSVDINLCSANSIYNTHFLRDLLNFDIRLRELMIFLKIWAKQLLLISRGGLNSYCLTTMILFYLQNPQSGKTALLPSIEKLQENIPEKMVMGVNYAYQLEGRIAPLPNEVTTLTLIKGFFKFYGYYDFTKTLISPYLGVGIPLQKFKNGTFPFTAYHKQLSTIAQINLESQQTFETEHALCIQDPFTLNHNIARSFQDSNMYYLRKCLNYACDVYSNTRLVTESERCEALLFGIIERMALEVGINISHKNLNTEKDFRFTYKKHYLDFQYTHTYREDSKDLNSKRIIGSVSSENNKWRNSKNAATVSSESLNSNKNSTVIGNAKELSNTTNNESADNENCKDMGNKMNCPLMDAESSKAAKNKTNLQSTVTENAKELSNATNNEFADNESCKDMGIKINCPSMVTESSKAAKNKTNLQSTVTENAKELCTTTNNESAENESCKDMGNKMNCPSITAESSEFTKNLQSAATENPKELHIKTNMESDDNESCRDTDNKSYTSMGNENSKVLNNGMNYQLSEMVSCSNMNYQCTPSAAELRAISTYVNTSFPKKVYDLWIEYYMEAITEILTEVYCLDLQFASPIHSDKHQRLDDTTRSHSFVISGSVDQWTGRLHHRYIDKSFMEFQLEQTERFAMERRQNSQFAVQINAILTVNIYCDKPAIDLQLMPRNMKYGFLIKKDPLRKFFMMFKCSLQNFNVKDKLNTINIF